MSTPISSTPISNLEELSKEPQLEVDENFEARETSDTSDVEPPVEPAEEEKKSSRTSLLAAVLGVLLLGSIAINIQQARVTAALESDSQRFEAALNEATTATEQEANRANSAESTLDGIGGAVDNVNDRIESLQQALGELRTATAR